MKTKKLLFIVGVAFITLFLSCEEFLNAIVDAITNSSFEGLQELVVMADGTIYATNNLNHIMRYKLNSKGNVLVRYIAGSTNLGHKNGYGEDARFNQPKAIIKLDESTLLVADQNNHVIRKIVLSANSDVVVVSDFAGIAGSAGNIDGAAVGTAKFDFPYGLAKDSTGNIYVSEKTRIRKINTGLIVSTIAGNGTEGHVNANGTSAQFLLPSSMVISSDNNTLYVIQKSDTYPAVRKIELNNNNAVSTLVQGKNFVGSVNSARLLDTPSGIAIDTSNNLYIASTFDTLSTNTNSRNRILFIPSSAPNTISQYSDNILDPNINTKELIYGLAINSTGKLYLAAGDHKNIFTFTSNSGGLSAPVKYLK